MPVIIGAVVAVLLIAYVAAAAFAGSKVPRDTTVSGVQIGGMSASEARSTLNSAFEEKLAAPLKLAVGDQEGELVPADAGLGVDIDSTVKKLTGFTLDPRVVFAHFTGGAKLDPKVTSDDAKLTSALTSIGDSLKTDPVDASVVFEDGKPSITEPKDGNTLNVDEAVPEVKSNFLSATGPLKLPTTSTAPKVGQEQLDAAKRDIIDPMTSGPVTVKVGDTSVELPVAELTAIATVDVAGNKLTLDQDKLKELVVEKSPELGSSGTDAKIVMEGGKPVVVPSKPGRALNADDLAAKVTTAAQSSEKTANVEMSESDAEFTTEDANKLGVKEIIGEFDTPLTADRVRTKNLIVGSKIISNTLIKPGETFSLLQALGPVTYERGFVDSGVVESGFATKALGGGLSQLSTTTFNAAFFAGMDLVEFRQHSRYFSRYPEGREATLWGPSLDMKWKNPTQYGVLVDAYVANNRVHVRLWSTKTFEVKSWTSPRRNITSPQVVYNQRPDCKPEHGTTPGFTVDFGRERYKDGKLHDKKSWTWTYNAWPIVKCGKP
ncbi:hypothetical protein BSZ39_06390 [Bowdeniella nasicola]|uniref:YoaR-like putative peptidoglycan binding domain-containing protein n=1 Tax=Bowdeniella nasicola TaxID=208480 RepID=A0A1Q5Q313_9ACTO|nr:VanW family protein [Bowdeniella nasicola]OKL54030.1 hypothetical protein BSZ39_06390 [Bowdeniella nasicola]